MKTALLIILLASPALAQSAPSDTAVAPGCGVDHAKFAVETKSNQHPAAQPEAGKALVYFLEDDKEFNSVPKPTTRAGVDGQWVGATHGNSYLYFSVEPGEHHLCASWQTSVVSLQGHQSAAAHFTAEPGGVYYFMVRNRWIKDSPAAEIRLKPLDSDEGLLLVSKFSLSVSHPKK